MSESLVGAITQAVSEAPEGWDREVRFRSGLLPGTLIMEVRDLKKDRVLTHTQVIDVRPHVAVVNVDSVVATLIDYMTEDLRRHHE